MCQEPPAVDTGFSVTLILTCVCYFSLLVLLDGALFRKPFKCALLHVARGQGGCFRQNESQTGGDVEENNVFS